MGKSMTALLSAFARAYHAEQKGNKVFCDSAARKLLGGDYETVMGYMAQAAAFFEADSAADAEAVDWVVNQKLAALPLCRAAFTEDALHNETRLGTRQYLVLGSGYDSFVYRRPDWASSLRVFLADRAEMLEDCRKRAQEAGLSAAGEYEMIPADFSQQGWATRLEENKAFSKRDKTFVSMLGLTYYLDREDFEGMLSALSGLLAEGSAVAFDYMDAGGSEDMRRQGMLARAAGEPMRQGYDYDSLEGLLARHGFLIYEHLTADALDDVYFAPFNRARAGREIHAMDGVNCCLAVKKA